MKKILTTLTSALLLLLAFCGAFCGAFCAEASAANDKIVTGSIKYEYNGSVIVNNEWELDKESGTLTIKSVGTGYNETGTGQEKYKKYGAWSDYKDLIKRVVLDGRFNKVSNNAFNGCKNLTEVCITKDVSQIDAYAFYGCSSLTTIWVGDYIKVEGMADIRNVGTIRDSILAGTAIESVRLSSKAASGDEESPLPKMSSFSSCLNAVYGEAGSSAEDFAAANGLKFFAKSANASVTLLREDGSVYDYRSVTSGMPLDLGVGKAGEALIIYEDKACTRLYDLSARLEEDITLYTRPVLSFAGFETSAGEREALRAIFEVSASDIANVAEIGVIAGLCDYALDDFTEDSASAGHKIVVWRDGEKVGSTISAPKNGTQRFAASAVGFEADISARSNKNIVFRGYVKTRNASGEEFIFYTAPAGTTLAHQKSDGVSGSAEGALRYDKSALMAILTDVYNDNEKLIVGQQAGQLGYPSAVLEAYETESGKKPAIIGIDLACYGADLTESSDEYQLKFTKELIDYARSGGIITASSHFANPLGSSSDRCRGTLGLDDMWERLLDEGDPLNVFFKSELTRDAKFLRDLEQNDVPILWRPFHEMNGGWFWFCITQGDDNIDSRTFTNTWKYVYDYYVNELGLTNLIWVYSPNNDTGSLVDVDYGYPGDEYVDFTGLDWYTSGKFEIDSDTNAYFKMMDHGVPTALTEYGGSNGKLDSIESYNDFKKMYEKGMKITYVLTWTSDNSFPVRGKLRELMAMPDVLSLGDLKSLFLGLK